VEEILPPMSEPVDQSADDLMAEVYGELHILAERYLLGERRGHTLQPTALIHEAYLKLAGGDAAKWTSRGHFLAVAARAMRQVLVTHAHRHRAAKRGRGWQQLALDDVVALFEAQSVDLIALDEALRRLAEIDALQARIVELRFFGGLSMESVADVLDLSLRTAEREWSIARAWLRRALSAE